MGTFQRHEEASARRLDLQLSIHQNFERERTNGFCADQNQRTILNPKCCRHLGKIIIRARSLVEQCEQAHERSASTHNQPQRLITAASATKTSFGCANERDWTYFGEAFFAKGLKETGALAPAFEKAKAIIARREADEQLTPSEPQIFIGEEFRRHFPALVGEMRADEAHLDAVKAR